MRSSGASSRRAVRRRKPRPRRGRADSVAPPGRGAWFDAAAADRACNFFSLFLSHHKGEWKGRPFILAPWQRARVVRPLFGWKREDGLRWYRRCDLWIPRKNGKSVLASGVALYVLFADHEPSAEVYLVANDKAQAGIVFGYASGMVRAEPELRDASQVYDSARTKASVVPEAKA